jgi:hypothetical protein
MPAFEYISYKTASLHKDEQISKLQRFSEIDKYRSFYKILPAVVHSKSHEREIISAILDVCANELLSLFKAEKKAHKATVKKVINNCMRQISAAVVSTVNKDFAYELCWYLSDIAGLEMKKASGGNAWGYWDVIADNVKVIEYKPGQKSKK